MGAMLIEVKLFAGLREAAGAGEVEVEVEDGATADGLLDELRQLPGLGEVLTRMRVRVAVNRQYVDGAQVLSEGDEVALVPPISGGARVRATVSDEPLDVAAIVAEAGDPAAGAVVTFQGMTREVSRLDYEAYAEMAEQRIAGILDDCVERHGLTGAVAEHRVGPVPLGEASVIVAVSAPHRPEAFEGAREAIDRIKAEAPVWKIEVAADGSRSRVEGELPEVDRA
jgi:molybdopterin synthase catalytic subunit